MVYACPSHNRIVTVRRLSAARVRSARSGRYARSHASLTHIASPRKPTVCFIGGWQRQLQPKRYVQWGLNLLKKYKKGKLEGKKGKNS